MQAAPVAGQQRQAEFQHDSVELLVRLRLPDRGQARLDARAVFAGEVLHSHREFGRLADALGAVRQELDPQHRVVLGELRRCPRQPGGIDRAAVEFDVEMRRNAAQQLVVVAPDPQRVLHRCERERLRCVSRGVFGRRRGRRFQVRRFDQLDPGAYRWSRCQPGKIDVDTLTPPTACQRHHPDRVQTLRDEIGVWIQAVRGHAQHLGD